MKPLILLLAVLTSLQLQAATYYFSSTTGNDSYSAAQAQNPATPWKSLDKLNSSFSSFQPGDVIYLRRGDIFYGSIKIGKSGSASAPIRISAYGDGAKPVVTGFTTISGWSAAGSNTYEASSSAFSTAVRMVVVNGIAKAAGRYPNANAANKGYLYFQSSTGNTSITDDRLNGSNYNGGEIVIRKNRWVLDRNTIINHSGNQISYSSQSGYAADAGFGYFIQNHPATLDQDGEWSYNSQEKRLRLFSIGGSQALNDVKVATIDVLVEVRDVSNIDFDNICFTGSNEHSFYLKNAQHIRISDCEIVFNGRNAITADNANYVTIANSHIDNTNNNALNGISCSHTTVKGNRITRTGVFAGMGDGDSGSYEALMLSGNNNTLELNRIDSTGYIPITFNGNDIMISKNFISNYAFVKDDGGGIYTWNNGHNAQVNTNRTISENIVLNAIGAGEGTPHAQKKFAHGIYIDDNAANVKVEANTVAHCSGFGLYVHNARDLTIINNTLYNNVVQLTMEHDDIAPNHPVANNTVTGNILFSVREDQPVAEYKTRADDLNNFGTFNNNYYCRPVDDNAVINTLKKVNGSYVFQQVDLEGWKAMYGKDPQSKITSKQFAPFVINQVIGNEQYANGNFNNNIGGLYVYSNQNNCTANWTSEALDGGALKVAFSTNTNSGNKGTVIIGVGAVTANKTYNLKFSLLGTTSQKMMDVYLRKSLAPYNDITARKLVKTRSERKEISLVFTASETHSDASIGIDIPEQVDPVYLDNISLREVVATPVNVLDSLQFLYNANTVAENHSLPVPYIDVANKAYNNNVSVPAHSSLILLQAAPSAIAVTPAQCSAAGSISYERWLNVGGNDISNNNWSNAPSSTTVLTSFEAPSNAADNFASRIRGYICAPQTGYYTFWIAGDDATELYLSTDDDPTKKIKICYSLSWTNSREWNRYASQKSAPVMLQSGKKYYIEALHKEGGGGDNLAVAWQLPSGEMEAPILGSRLSPFQSTGTVVNTQSIDFAVIADVTYGVAPITLHATASSGLPVTFKIVSGNATVSGNTCSINGTGIVTIEASQPGNANYAAAPVITRTFNVLAAPAPVTCAATGSILREQWNNVPGNNLWDNNWNNAPSSSSQVNLFEGATDAADNYASRIRGYICPPQTGTYTFWIAGDDASELYLSTSSDAGTKTKIAYSQSWTGRREWNKYSSQKSAAIVLEAGKKYYIEAIHKEGNGGDNLAVAWQLPNGTFEGPIPGERLSPFQVVATSKLDQSINFPALADVVVGSPAISLAATATSGLPVTYTLISGPGSLAANTVTALGAGIILIEASQPGNTQYNAAMSVRREIVVLAGGACTASGTISREYWANVGGNNLWDHNWNSPPTSITQLTFFEGPVNVADNYASRIRGYICPPQDGNYTFWISGDDATELYLSSDANPSNRSKIAYSTSWTDTRQWDKYSTQRSVSISLKAGGKYFIEAIQKEGGGGDNLAVGWQLPNGIKEMPIPGNRLTPYQQPEAQKTFNVSSKELTIHTRKNFKVHPNPVVGSAVISFQLEDAGIASLVLYDSHGRFITTLFSGNVVARIKKQINLRGYDYAPGFYFLKLFSDKEVLTEKIIISK